MLYYKFKKNETLNNTIKAHPKIKFDVNRGRVYYNNLNIQPGAFTDNVTHTTMGSGSISLYEMNIDRPAGELIYPFVTKQGNFEALQGVSKEDYVTSYELGDIIKAEYPLSASLTRDKHRPFSWTVSPSSRAGSHILALQNTLNYYTALSPHYAFTSSLLKSDEISPLWNKAEQEINLLYVPSIFYGSEIRKGTVDLSFYLSGTLVGRLQDKNYNGELIQTDGTDYAQENGSGSVAGVVLYTEGIILLTGSWDMTKVTHDWGDGFAAHTGSWLDFAAGAKLDEINTAGSASFGINFEGTNYIQTVTMFAHADKNKLNYSTNPTFVNYDSYQNNPVVTDKEQYTEASEIELYNTVSSSFYEYEEKFKHQTFISKIGIYDENKNLIAIANLATPIKKNGDRDFTFKLKLDI